MKEKKLKDPLVLKKTTIILNNGKVVDCGEKEYNDLVEAFNKKDPKAVAICTAKLMASSNLLMEELVAHLQPLLSKELK